MQARPPAVEKYVAPTPPGVPIVAVQSLVPRLLTAINDIDGLKSQLAAGNADGSMPNWDMLLQRYSMLLSRVQQLTHYIARPPDSKGPNPAPGAAPVGAGRGAPGPSAPTSSVPALAHYVVHPLRPLPADANPLAPDTFFQAINTQSLPAVTAAQKALFGEEEASDGGEVTMKPADAAEDFLNLDALQRLDENALTRLTVDLRARLTREAHRAKALTREIMQREGEYDWTMRLPEEGDDGAKDDDDDDDDLFGADEDEDGDAAMAAPPLPNPRQGWSVADYLRLMDTGRNPSSPGAAPAAPAAT